MKKSAQWIISVFALLLMGLNASYAEQAKDLTAMARITMSAKQGNFDNAMTDNRYRTAWFTKFGYVQFDLPDGEMCYGLYICLSEQTVTFSVQKNTGGQWEDVQLVQPEFLHVYVPFKEGMTSFRICCRDERDDIYLRVAEIRLLGEGEMPAWVQNWHRLEEKADLLIFTAHPDDELLWFGGTLPTYAAELGKNVQLVCMTVGERQRMNELLDALWTCGMKNYPEIGGFPDKRVTESREAFAAWGGAKKRIYPYVTGMIRKYKPDVVLTQDLNGEYGHGAHKAIAKAVIQGVELASQADYDADSAQQYGVWQVQKLYLHLYKENQLMMDWNNSLPAFKGKTSFEVAYEALQKHRSQFPLSQDMQQGGVYDCRKFGLYFSIVGADEAGNDFFEHIQPSAALMENK